MVTAAQLITNQENAQRNPRPVPPYDPAPASSLEISRRTQTPLRRTTLSTAVSAVNPHASVRYKPNPAANTAPPTTAKPSLRSPMPENLALCL
jgi:hypothetical protein